ncbi:MAG: hypothetical protein BRD55_04560 [Bacteroidetes bacterium SW_9_63_38]|nr:MAG: hypothetical protein BRD55_04560 [Bacteroidetes bacterium SW_9_63_38]
MGLLLVWGLAAGVSSPAAAQRFLPDDPLWSDPDRMDMPFPAPQPVETVQEGPVELLRRLLAPPIETPTPAANVNTVEGVPNSSWYTNRHYRSPRSDAALRRGPNTTPDPAQQGSWQVEQIHDSALPRATIRDSTGRRFQLLFDTETYPELATGAAMVSSRLLHALGYNVPHYWLHDLRRDRLAPSPNTPVTDAAIDSLLTHTLRTDSTYRALVSRIPDVERRIGPFSFRGRRVDDANDVFPHEDRRELRSLRVVAAWLHHSMIRRRHTLDVGVQEDGRRFVRHYLTNLHITLGSAGARPKPRWSGHKHVLEFDQVLQRAATIGLSGAPWLETNVPHLPGLGHFGAIGFVPEEWRPEWPSPAFQRLAPADAFWAAKNIRHFSRSDLATIVETADYSSDATETYIVETLRRRRDAIGRAYLSRGGGLGRFTVQGDTLRFRDLHAQYNDAPDSLRRTITWHVFKNQSNELGRRLAQSTTRREAIPIPPSRARFLRVRLQSQSLGETRVFLRRTLPQTTLFPPMSMPYEVVGIKRRGERGN